MMKTEKRRANVGERILITKATEAQGNYKNGDVSTVVEIDVFGESGTVRVKEHVRPIYASEYEVIVSEPKKSARIKALETQVAVQREELDVLQAKVEALEATAKFPNTARFERESAEVDAIMADIERKAKPTPNEQRADVIKRAKAYVAKWTKRAASITREDGNSALMNRGSMTTEFIVNADKRTVVCLAKSNVYGDIRGKGIAKCDPDDVFNADIGKAIALARALGVNCPTEFVKAVQPTEVVVGHKLSLKDYYGNERGGTVTHFETHRGDKCAMFKGDGGASLESADGKATLPNITNDTDAVYE